MNSKYFASIDIGTNTLLMLLAKKNESDELEYLEDYHSIPRLGEGLAEFEIISESSLNRAIEYAYEIKKIFDKYDNVSIRAVATSAIREAKNGEIVKKSLEEILQCSIEIISGDEEAKLSYLGSIEGESNSVVIDIGGGSTEFIAGFGTAVNYFKSIPIGAVKLYENFFFGKSDLKAAYQNANENVIEKLKELDFDIFKGDIIAVAGTPTTLALIDLNVSYFDKKLIHNHFISKERLDELTYYTTITPSEKLIQLYNIPKNKADILKGGSIILNQFVKAIKGEGIIVSTKGLRYGVIKSILK